jgi:ribosomal protein L37AE/L43A
MNDLVCCMYCQKFKKSEVCSKNHRGKWQCAQCAEQVKKVMAQPDYKKHAQYKKTAKRYAKGDIPFKEAFE